MENVGEKIIDYLNLLNSEDVNKDGYYIDLKKYPSLNIEDVNGYWKSWTFKLQKLFFIYFGTTSCIFLEYKDATFHDRTIMYLSETIFGDVDDYTYEKHLEDVEETIHYIRSRS